MQDKKYSSYMSKTAPDAVPWKSHRRVPQYLARRFAQICIALQTEDLEPHRLLNWHVALLVQIRDTPGRERNALALAIGIDATSCGQALERFHRDGVVLRGVQDGDQRAAAFTLTPAGEELVTDLVRRSRITSRRLLEPLSQGESETLLTLLARLIEAHETHARPGADRRPPRRHKTEEVPCATPPAAPLSASPQPASPPEGSPRRRGRNGRSG